MKVFRKLYLYGSLAEQFGREFRVYAATLLDALNVVEANFPGKFFSAIREGEFKLVRGDDLDSGDTITAEFLAFRSGKGDYHIAPHVAGAKSAATKGLLSIVAGIAIVATAGGAAIAAGAASSSVGGVALNLSTAAAFSAGAGTAALGGLTTLGGLTLFGAAIALGGISTLLAPGVKTDFDDQGDTGSFTFGGHSNVSYEGVTHPLVYGKVIAGSVVISSSISIEDYVSSSTTGSNHTGSYGATGYDRFNNEIA